MPITMTCFCGRRESVANAMAGQTLVCPGCGRTVSVPTLDVLRRLRAKAQSREEASETPDAGPASRSGRVLVVAATALALLLCGVSWLAWLASKDSRQRPTPLAQADRPREDPKQADPLYRQPADEQEPNRTEPDIGRVKLPDPPKESPPPVEVAKPQPIVEPAKPLVETPKPLDRGPVEIKKPLLPAANLLVWKLKDDETFYQEVIVTQKPAFAIQGLPVQLLLQYRVVSSFTVQKVNEDGSRVVQQKVESAKLLQADELTQGAVAGPVAQLPGTTYTLHLSPMMEVTRCEGGAAAQPGLLQLLGGQGMQLATLVDRDGWKELAQMTFFQMDQPLKLKERWSKPLTHQWGALGSWSGQIHYDYRGQKGDVHTIGYGLDLKYKAPAKDALLAGMQVMTANFQPQIAAGLLTFDSARGKVVMAEERFRVKGVLTANVLGQQTPIEIDEDQHFLIRIHDKKVP